MQCSVILACGYGHQEEVSMNDTRNMLWESQPRVFHLSSKCCVDRITATERGNTSGYKVDLVGLGFKVYTESYC